MTTLSRSRRTQALVDAAGVAAVVFVGIAVPCGLLWRAWAMWGMR